MPSPFWKTLPPTALSFACLLAGLPTYAAPQAPPPKIISGSGPSVPNPHLDPVVPSGAPSAQFVPHKLYLKYVTPDEVLNKMGWTSTLSPNNGPNSSALPQGVDRIYAIEGDDSLLVFATADGFNLIKQAVQSIDVAAKQVSMGVAFVYANAADVDALGIPFHSEPAPVQIASGSDAVRLYGLTNKIKARLDVRPTATVDDDFPASFPIGRRVPFLFIGPPIIPNASGATAHQIFYNVDPNSRLTIWPHINSDRTITLGIEPFLEVGLLSKKDVHFTLAPLVLQTLPSGDTVAVRLDLTDDEDVGFQPLNAASERKDYQPMTLLIFITATITDATAPKPTAAPPSPVAP